ncbi:MAG: ABC transporter ATP-binding protein [Alphaproteobacteria bacterium]|nr:ABC transporter ATP-binding protein [Alphaproteobacteria bacterium]
MTTLVVRDLVAGYVPGMPILDGVDIAVEPGEIVAVIGPNGAGKSTLLKAVAGQVPVTAGSIMLGATSIVDLPTHAMARAGIALVPQTRNVFATLTVRENLALGAQVLARQRRAERFSRVYELFPDLRAWDGQRARTLSGGQRQLLAFARALMADPAVLMLDEPSAGLAPRMVDAVLGQLRTLAADGIAVLIVEQNVKAVLRVADRACVLVEGRNRVSGRAADLADDPAISELFFGTRGPGGRHAGATSR